MVVRIRGPQLLVVTEPAVGFFEEGGADRRGGVTGEVDVEVEFAGEAVGEGEAIGPGCGVVAAVDVRQVDQGAGFPGPVFEADPDGEGDQLVLQDSDDGRDPALGEAGEEVGVFDLDAAVGQRGGHGGQQGAELSGSGDAPPGPGPGPAQVVAEPAGGAEPAAAAGHVTGVQLTHHRRPGRVERPLRLLQVPYRVQQRVVGPATDTGGHRRQVTTQRREPLHHTNSLGNRRRRHGDPPTCPDETPWTPAGSKANTCTPPYEPGVTPNPDGRGISEARRLQGQRAGLNRRRRSELVTTNTLENAMAAPASMGLSHPMAAIGMAATL